MTPRSHIHWGVILKETPRGPMHRRVEFPWGPMHLGNAKIYPLKIQNGPIHRGVEIPWGPMYPGMVFCFFEPSSHATAFKETLIQKTV